MEYKHLIDFPSNSPHNVVVVQFAGPDQPQKHEKRIVRICKAFKKRASSIVNNYSNRLTRATGTNSYVADLNRFIPQGLIDFGDIPAEQQQDYQNMLMNNAIQRYYESLDQRDKEFDDRRKRLIEENKAEQEEKKRVAASGGEWRPNIPEPPKPTEGEELDVNVVEADADPIEDGFDETFEDPSQKWCVLLLIKNEVGEDGCNCMAVLDVFKSENKARVHAENMQRRYPKYDYIPTRMYEWIDLDADVHALGVRYNHEGLAQNVAGQAHQHEIIEKVKQERARLGLKE